MDLTGNIDNMRCIILSPISIEPSSGMVPASYICAQGTTTNDHVACFFRSDAELQKSSTGCLYLFLSDGFQHRKQGKSFLCIGAGQARSYSMPWILVYWLTSGCGYGVGPESTKATLQEHIYPFPPNQLFGEFDMIQTGPMTRTGIGSKIAFGVHSEISCTSAMIEFARVGEQMKCITSGRARVVPSRSFGVNLRRGVRYSKLFVT